MGKQRKILAWPVMLLLTICISFHANANETWECNRSIGNVTIIATADYFDTITTQKKMDAFIRKISDELELNKLPFKILILTDPYGLNMLKKNTNNFSSIAYDTLRPVNLDILQKLFYRSTKRNDQNGGAYLLDTLDFGITNEKNLNELGLKIIFKHTRKDTSYQFDRIYTLVKFGVENIDKIKRTQRNLYVTSYGMHQVAVKTIDTASINQIATIKLGFDPYHLPPKKIPFISIAIVVSIVAALYGFKQSNKKSA